MTTFGSTTEDLDGVPIDRGPPSEDRLTPAELRGSMQDIHKAKATMGELATVKGIEAQIKMVQKQLEDVLENNNRLVNLYSTLRNEFDQFKTQRAIELQNMVAGGSTTPEDK